MWSFFKIKKPLFYHTLALLVGKGVRSKYVVTKTMQGLGQVAKGV